MAFKPITEEQYATGADIGRHRLEAATIAQSVSYDTTGDWIMLEIGDYILGIPRSKISELDNLSPEDLADIRLSAIGDAIRVGSCDVYIDLGGLKADIMPHSIFKKAFALAAISAAKAKTFRKSETK